MNFNATLLGQSITFLLFVWFCMKYVWPPLMQALEERQAKIADGLAAAERGQQDLEKAKAQVGDNMKVAKEQAQEIINQAQKRATEIVDEAKGAARTEADKIKASAEAELEQSLNSAKEQLRKDVSIIALSGAERILNKEIDAKAHSAVLDDLMAQI